MFSKKNHGENSGFCSGFSLFYSIIGRGVHPDRVRLREAPSLMSTKTNLIMAYNIRRVDYFYTTVKDEPGESYHILNLLADIGINLVAFTAVPVGPDTTQLTLFPDSTQNFLNKAKQVAMKVEGPFSAFLVNGDDELGALAKVHQVLFDAKINIFASSGVIDGKGAYGYVIYVRPEDHERAAQALRI